MRTRCEKEKIVSNLSKQFEEASCFYIINLFKINVANMMNFRRVCREGNVSLHVVKTSLINIALQNSKVKKEAVKEIKQVSSKQMSGILFVEEKYNTPARLIKNFKKELDCGVMNLKCAYVDGDVFIGDDKLTVLSNLKSKNELISDVVYSLYGGINNVISRLNSGKNIICGIIETLKKN